MRNPRLKELFNLISDLIAAAVRDDHDEQERLLQRQNDLIPHLTPREYYKYMATLAASREDKTFKELDAEIVKSCKSNNIAIKSKYLVQHIAQTDEQPQPTVVPNHISQEMTAVAYIHPAPAKYQ